MKYSFPLKTIVTFLFFITSCKIDNERESIKSDNLKIIKLNLEKKPKYGEEEDFEKYFTSADYIVLETNKNSILGTGIARIGMYDERIYILNESKDGIFIFDNNGKFINKIQNIGKGPQEYLDIVDFAINEDKKEIILYSFAPNKLHFYDFNGKFIKEKVQEESFYNIGYSENKLLFYKRNEDSNYLLTEKSLELDEERNFLKKKYRDELFKINYNTPYIIKSFKQTYLSLPYYDTIYKYNGNLGLEAKYFIDFGKNKMPEEIFKKKKEKLFSTNYASENNYGFGVRNFRESKNYIIFNYHLNKLAIHSKRENTTETFLDFKKNFIGFSNYWPHDGNNEKLIAIYSALNFKKSIGMLKKVSANWDKLPQKIKDIDNQISEESNPILIMYTLK